MLQVEFVLFSTGGQSAMQPLWAGTTAMNNRKPVPIVLARRGSPVRPSSPLPASSERNCESFNLPLDRAGPTPDELVARVTYRDGSSIFVVYGLQSYIQHATERTQMRFQGP